MSRDRPRLPAGRGALLAIACLFLGSAIVRFASGPAVALAEGAALRADVAASREGAITDDDLSRVLADLAEREAVVSRREREVETRLAAAELAETRARAAVAELEAAEAALRSTMAIADGAAESDLAQLTAMYEAMKPQQAAPLFQQMAPDFAAGFLGRMRPDAAAAILAGVSPESAYAISVILAGRNAEVPRTSP
jgi:flagellar motility protein MotE (MotC chaperone)